MEMTPATIRALLDAFEDSDWREMTVTIGGDRLHVSRDVPSANGTASAAPVAPAPASAAPAPVSAAPAPAAAPPPPAPVVEQEADPDPGAVVTAAPPVHAPGTAIESPSVGLFWRAPAPGAEPFVEVGRPVAAGDTVAIVEVMKLMNHVTSPVAGVVSAILVADGEAVEFGQPLVVVDPDGG
jgi:acetyl-CoA carboxylase biotin carboxyl carrier protein